MAKDLCIQRNKCDMVSKINNELKPLPLYTEYSQRRDRS